MEAEDEAWEAEEGGGNAVTLGFVRQPCIGFNSYSTKAGGAPAWLDTCNLPPMEDACCGFCQEPLQFLLQRYLPLNDGLLPRALFVFMCPSMACLKAHQTDQKNGRAGSKSIKVFRAHLDKQNPLEGEPLRRGVDLCSWCRTWRGDKRCGSCRKVSYCSRKHQVEHWRAGHSFMCKTGASNEIVNKRLWPELEIYSDVEEDDDDEDGGKSLEIVPAYKEPEPEGFEEASKGQQFWAAFQARIQRAPDQVVRYSRESTPLWMRLDGQPESADILPCHVCGGPRVFEFQVMSQLLYFFGVENEIDSLDWGTIAIYTCQSSCRVEGYTEELAWVQPTP